jgi:hypothetical protein
MAAGSHCRWCPAKPDCPEHIEAARHAVVEPIVDENMTELLALAEQVEAWAKSVFERGYELAADGVQIPGWKLVQKAARRSWDDPEEMVKLLRNRKLKNEEIFDRKLKSPAQIEKLLRKLGKDATFVSDHAPAISSGTTLVHGSDKRPAVETEPSHNLKELNL